MLTAIVVVTASILASATSWFICRQIQQGLMSQIKREVDALQLKITQLTQTNSSLQDDLVEQKGRFQEKIDKAQMLLKQETLRLNDLVNRHQIKAVRLEAMLISERKRSSEKNKEFQEVTDELSQQRASHNQAEQRVKELETRLDEQQVQNQKAMIQLQENKEALKQEFKQLAHEIFESRGKVLSEQHHNQLYALLAPFKEQLGEFRNKLEETQKEDNISRASLKQQLETMYQLNRKMTDDAESLANALKGDKKLQGSWGEMQVETILENSGLIKGQEYEREPNFRNEEGHNMRPDFIVHLPEGKHLIIDSKVSLVDYMAFVNATTDTDRNTAMTRHIQSIRNHINNLSQKDYPNLPDINTPDFVFMFMPVEPAFISAFRYDQQLFHDAFEKHIVVVTPTTLLATLRTVANLWTIERQSANTRKLAEKGRLVYDKLRVFVEKMEKLDIQLSNARMTYDEAMSTLKHGRGNLIAQADQFLTLGIRVKKELPAKTLETADLEPHESDEVPFSTNDADLQELTTHGIEAHHNVHDSDTQITQNVTENQGEEELEFELDNIETPAPDSDDTLSEDSVEQIKQTQDYPVTQNLNSEEDTAQYFENQNDFESTEEHFEQSQVLETEEQVLAQEIETTTNTTSTEFAAESDTQDLASLTQRPLHELSDDAGETVDSLDSTQTLNEGDASILPSDMIESSQSTSDNSSDAASQNSELDDSVSSNEQSSDSLDSELAQLEREFRSQDNNLASE